jgi:hypothetical protein
MAAGIETKRFEERAGQSYGSIAWSLTAEKTQ